jgi:DNA topoisomerase-1
MNIVIVESAAKAKTINKYLGSAYKVIASYGHVRDLPPKDGSVLPDQNFAMHWDVDPDSAKIMNDIAKAVKGADKLILATDPDREGEAISWHILEILQKKRALKDVEVVRVAFNAVTRDAVLDALAHPRSIDAPLVDAYLARRALDYLVGFTLSPVLWRKLPHAKSAGRVQSVALRLVCNREAEIEAFKSREFWTVSALLKTRAESEFSARLVSLEGRKLDKFDIPDEAEALRLKAAVENSALSVEGVESKEQKRHPAAPFTTSTLQQEASRKLGLSPKQTMQIAQKLYEGVDLDGETVGLITYMRTDGVQIVPEAISQCRSVIGSDFGDRYLPPRPRDYKTKAKNAQEAHEAIRPTDFARRPDRIRPHLNELEAKLYRLIWQRAVASQMSSALFERTAVEIAARSPDGAACGLRATGSVVLFDGFLKLYEEGHDDTEENGDSARLPRLSSGEPLEARTVDAVQHFTEPPPRYTEATLIKNMEELGIGRPSTYAATMNVLQEREYVRVEKKRLIPEGKGRLVTAFLESFFKRYIEYGFTASLEEKLDLISDGKLTWTDVLREFWRDFTAAVADTKDLRVSEVLDALNEILGPTIFPQTEEGADPRRCPACGAGQLSLKIGRYGAFIGCSNYPECRYTRQLTGADGDSGPDKQLAEEKVLGEDPETGLQVLLKSGRFGPYVQLGEPVEGGKPKRASIPKGFSAAGMTLEQALRLLSLPRRIGLHPETQKPMTAGIGRFGPFIEHDGKYANLESVEDVFTIGVNRAVSILAEPKQGRARQRAKPVLKDVGEHPDGGRIQVLSGRYGPYIKHDKTNATLPKGLAPEDVTLEEAIKLIAAKSAAPAKERPKKGTKAKDSAKSKDSKANQSADKPRKAGKTAGSAKESGKAESAAETETDPKTESRKKKAASSKTSASMEASSSN